MQKYKTQEKIQPRQDKHGTPSVTAWCSMSTVFTPVLTSLNSLTQPRSAERLIKKVGLCINSSAQAQLSNDNALATPTQQQEPTYQKAREFKLRLITILKSHKIG